MTDDIENSKFDRIDQVFENLAEQVSNTKIRNVILAYSMCLEYGLTCDWEGWLLEGVEGPNNWLRANTMQTCPTCGSDLYRTGHIRKLVEKK